jgi:hypothetical protein
LPQEREHNVYQMLGKILYVSVSPSSQQRELKIFQLSHRASPAHWTQFYNVHTNST